MVCCTHTVDYYLAFKKREILPLGTTQVGLENSMVNETSLLHTSLKEKARPVAAGAVEWEVGSRPSRFIWLQLQNETSKGRAAALYSRQLVGKEATHLRKQV